LQTHVIIFLKIRVDLQNKRHKIRDFWNSPSIDFLFLKQSRQTMNTLNLHFALQSAGNSGNAPEMLCLAYAADMSVHMTSVRIQKTKREVCPT